MQREIDKLFKNNEIPLFGAIVEVNKKRLGRALSRREAAQGVVFNF
jgi:hypothetical protein